MVIAIHSENLLFSMLPAEDYDLLRRHLRGTLLRSQAVLFDTGDNIEWAYFPHRGVVSLNIVLANGQMIETAIIGRDGVVGGHAALDPQPASVRAVVEIEGAATTIDIETLRQLAATRESIRSLLLRHEQMQLARTQQIAACNAVHSLEARFCRWLLAAHDMCGGAQLTVTQEKIAELLGVRRTSICLVAHTMQQTGLIRTRRGQIEILDEAALRAMACECYALIAGHAARLRTPNQHAAHEVKIA
jgi:CRP-like cAMP-binding protein